MNRRLAYRLLPYAFWIMALVAVPAWISFDSPGWDAEVYVRAVRSVRVGHDPYADGIAVQDAFRKDLANHPDASPPYTYVYSPMTLPLLRVIGAMPAPVFKTGYWLFYVGCVLAQIWVGARAAAESERVLISLLAPAAAFFPGLLCNDTVLSGNVAFILYGLMLAAALLGWRRNRWLWFYLAVLAASCFKAPMLSLVVIPALSARKQWTSVGIAAAAGVALFAVQPLIWPLLFHNYLRAVGLQFSYNFDYGCSPAGIFSYLTAKAGMPPSPAGAIFYLLYAALVLGALFYLSRRYLQGDFSLEQWIPVLIAGDLLLNPRLMEYDMAPLALPLALIAWRFAHTIAVPLKATIGLAVCFAITNRIAASSPQIWKTTGCALLSLLFCAGCWTLLQQSRTGRRRLMGRQDLVLAQSHGLH